MARLESRSIGPNAHDGRVSEARPTRARVTALDRWLVRRALAAVGNPPLEFVLWTGEAVRAHDGSAVARVHLHDRGSLLSVLTRPDSSFGELYSAGRIEVEGDLVAALEGTYRSIVAHREHAVLDRLRERIGRLQPVNTIRRARSNVRYHYDIGNDFYRLWLDRDWQQYTCAYFPKPEMTLEQAQEAKLRLVCRKLRLRPGDRVVEAGCGWGGLARFMAREFGVHVRAYNTSPEQVSWARDRAARDALDDRVEYVEDDYRSIRGSYDVFVSVGMLEHVGLQNYSKLGSVIRNCLKTGGRGLIHSIGRSRPGPLNPWIRRRIFPGAYPPTLGEMAPIFEPVGLALIDVENLRLHYARTLEHWLARFETNRDQVREMFDEPFVRAWRLYLAGSIAAFTTGSLQLFQVVFGHAQDNDLPWSRRHLIADED